MNSRIPHTYLLKSLLVLWATVSNSGIGVAQPTPQVEVAFGVIFPLSTSSSLFGIPLEKGFFLALEERLGTPDEIATDEFIYKPTSFMGVQVRVFLADDKAEPIVAEKLATSLIAGRKVVAIIGSGNSNCTAQVRDVGVACATPIPELETVAQRTRTPLG